MSLHRDDIPMLTQEQRADITDDEMTQIALRFGDTLLDISFSAVLKEIYKDVISKREQ